MNHLVGKVAIVTGSSSGIGKAIALRFGEEGAKVVLAARRLHLCEQTVARIQAKGGEAFAIQTDVSDEHQVNALIQQTVTRYGQLDILVNNAGIFGGGRLVDTDTKTFDDVIATNLRGTFLCCRAGFQQMKQQGRPHHKYVECGRSASLEGYRDLQRFQTWNYGADKITG
jgi:3-oxoacyl-[acyl-carrier protein] reductase